MTPNHDPLRMDALLRAAKAPAAGRVRWFERIDSTNTWLLRQPDLHARVCIAELQTAGRGRRGRVWRAAAGSSVLLSIGWCLRGAAVGGLSLVSGLAAVEALRRIGVGAVGLKWPNDLMAADGKLGGVLVEVSGERCVIGVGVNVDLAAGGDDGHAAPAAVGGDDGRGTPAAAGAGRGTLSSVAAAGAGQNTPPSSPDDNPTRRIDLHSLGHQPDRDTLAAALIITHCEYLRRFCAGGFAPFMTDWNRLNVHRDRRVSVQLTAESFTGTVRGIDHDGALLVEHNGTPRRVVSAEASIRSVTAG